MSIFIETQSLSVALTFSLHIKNIDFLLDVFLSCRDESQTRLAAAFWVGRWHDWRTETSLFTCSREQHCRTVSPPGRVTLSPPSALSGLQRVVSSITHHKTHLSRASGRPKHVFLHCESMQIVSWYLNRRPSYCDAPPRHRVALFSSYRH